MYAIRSYYACIIDRSVETLSDFVVGANIEDKHYFGLNWERDLPVPAVADLRNVVEGDPSPCGGGTLSIKRGIEVGHVFQLGSKYSNAMSATVLDENGKAVIMEMGCYGIGVTRVVAAAIEQNYDDKGIIWPAALAPFSVALVPLNYDKSRITSYNVCYTKLLRRFSQSARHPGRLANHLMN